MNDLIAYLNEPPYGIDPEDKVKAIVRISETVSEINADKLNEALNVLPAIATQLERLNDAIEQHLA